MHSNLTLTQTNYLFLKDMADISTPLKQFREAVVSNEAMGAKRAMVEQRGQSLKVFSNRLSKTANVVAFANARNRRRSEALHHLRSQVQNLTPQLINAGTIRMNYPENKAAEENFENLRKQYAEGVLSIRDICDESIDVKIFLKLTEEYIRRAIDLCESGIRDRNRKAIMALKVETGFGKSPFPRMRESAPASRGVIAQSFNQIFADP